MEWSQQPLFRSPAISRTPRPPKPDHRRQIYNFFSMLWLSCGSTIAYFELSARGRAYGMFTALRECA
jgi:hypothetical protein